MGVVRYGRHDERTMRNSVQIMNIYLSRVITFELNSSQLEFTDARVKHVNVAQCN